MFTVDSTSRTHFVSCDQCHTQAPAQGGHKNAEFDFNRASCDNCHAASGPASTQAVHASFGYPIPGSYNAGDPNNSSACLGCHPGGGMAANFNHVWFPLGQGQAHGAGVTKCADCHLTPATYQGDPRANLPAIGCTKCHNDDPANQKNQNGLTVTAVHLAPKVGRDIWNIPGGYRYTQSEQCLDCHAGNIGGDVAPWSTPLVFRLAQHDNHCRMADKTIAANDPAHAVNQNTDRTGVNTCFGCHDATTGAGSTPWARNWPVAKTSQTCVACHKHVASPAPLITCR
ncbi:MAG: hypothetical protein NVS4B10_08240 [Myxococcales bacterium]